MDKAYVIAIDTVDPDNYVLVRTVQSAVQQELIAPGDIYVIITARAYWNRPENELQERLPNRSDSEELQWASANRLITLLHNYSHQTVPIYRGGMARNPVIPNSSHFQEHIIYGALDPERSVFRSMTVIDELEFLVEKLYRKEEITILSGGPLTGVAELIQLGQKELSDRIVQLNAVYAHKDKSLFAATGGATRVGNFNTSADAPSGKAVIESLNCEINLFTTDVNKDSRLDIQDLDNLKSLIDMSSRGNKAFVETLAEPWYTNVVRRHNSKWFLYDFMLTAYLLDNNVCQLEPMMITDFPAPIDDISVWGKISFEPDVNSNVHVATRLKRPSSYFKSLRKTLL